MWDFTPVTHFWLFQHLSVTEPTTASVFLVNPSSVRDILRQQRRILLVGVTAAYKIFSSCCKLPYSLVTEHWTLSFLDVLYLELSNLSPLPMKHPHRSYFLRNGIFCWLVWTIKGIYNIIGISLSHFTGAAAFQTGHCILCPPIQCCWCCLLVLHK